MTVAISIVVPTHNRLESVIRLLATLGRQAPVDGGFEAIVVADGCTDRTVDRLRSIGWPFPVIVLEQPSSGPSAARNHGAARASGAVLVFFDDDMEPEPLTLRAHAAFHAGEPNGVGLGDVPPSIAAPGYFGTILRGWWEGMYGETREPGHRYQYRDLLSGHFSIPKTSFDAIGGFDEALRCHEDWDLGYRAIAAGMRLQLLPQAIAHHHDPTTLPKTLRRKYDDGVADVQLIAKYPEVARRLPLWKPRGGRKSRALVRLAWDHPAIGDRVAAAIPSLLGAYEVMRLRFRWRAVLEDLLDYWYWRGVAAASGSRDRLRRRLALPPLEPPRLTIDLAEGIEAARATLDAERPESVRLTVRDHLVGDVPAEAGAERLRGVHLPLIIARRLANEYIDAAARAGLLPPTLDDAEDGATTIDGDAGEVHAVRQRALARSLTGLAREVGE